MPLSEDPLVRMEGWSLVLELADLGLSHPYHLVVI